jgi:predicted transcriptional regulator
MTKVLISVPDELLQRIDGESRDRRLTRSAFLEEAARHELGWSGADAIDAALLRGREAVEGIGAFESADLVRNDRNTRDAGRG